MSEYMETMIIIFSLIYLKLGWDKKEREEKDES